jgi:hypothetical protein
VIISVNFASFAGVRPASDLQKYAAPLAVDENWILHRHRVLRQEEQGKIIDDRLSVEDFLQIERDETEQTVSARKAPHCNTGMQETP